MSDYSFLSETNICGQQLLRLVSRGSAIIAELLRLSKYIPPAFAIDDPKAEHAPLMFDFRFLNQFELIDHKIESRPELVDLDQQFRETYLPVLERFFKLFESIYRYIHDYKRFLQDLEEGVFIQQTFPSVLVDPQGKQLLAEALYLYGVMLLIMDARIDGAVRERMLMAYFRYVGTVDIEFLEETCKLCKATGDKKSKSYPDDFFARYTIPQNMVLMIIGRMRSDDIYQQMSYYPDPDHRSTALANQASMLFVLLYFVPNVLHKETTIMREIVDKFFPDNWVITYYMGIKVDLSDCWMNYKAASDALKNTLLPENVKKLYAKYVGMLSHSRKAVQFYLVEGNLSETEALERTAHLTDVLRVANVTIRWLMLHHAAQTTDKKLKPFLISIPTEELLLLLLDTAQFEYALKDMFERLLGEKRSKWEYAKSVVKNRLLELSAYFSGEVMLTEKIKDEQLKTWFAQMAGKISELDYEDSTLAGRKIQNMVSALEGVEQFHQIESSLQVKQFLANSRELLHRMIRTINIREEVLITFGQVGDMSYAWEVISDYVQLMQTHIRKEPSLIIKLRSTFLKLASILELPLVRITQANSADLVSVSEYYSAELVLFVKYVMAIIPQSMFAILQQIIDLQTKGFRALPTRLNRIELKEYAQLDERYSLARLTFDVSKYTIGIMAMEKTLMGIIQIDPQQLLEDGIRLEVRRRIGSGFNDLLSFSTPGSTSSKDAKSGVGEFEPRLLQLANVMSGMQRSLEYIQDYVNVYGLKVWQDEFSRVVRAQVQHEVNPHRSRMLSIMSGEEMIPLGAFGRLMQELLNQTSLSRTTYVDAAAAWVDGERREVIGVTTFSLLRAAIGVVGLAGIDRLICVLIVKDLQDFLKRSAALTDVELLRKNAALQLQLAELISRIGQKQLLRRHISNELCFACRVHANVLASALDTLNKSILADIEAHYRNPEKKPYPSEDSSLLATLSEFLESSGMSDPLTKIYVTSDPIENAAFQLHAITKLVLSKIAYDNALDTMDRVLTKKKDEVALDGVPFALGLATVLKQMHSEYRIRFVNLMVVDVVGSISSLNPAKKPGLNEAVVELPADVSAVLHFLEKFCKLANVERKLVENQLPPFVFDSFFNSA
eukprot:ANDGO_06428.mRNA.1 WASH complex subunit strumpellin homolog